MTAREFNETVVPLHGKLFRYAYRYLNDRDEAKDAVQEIFLKLWNQRNRLGEYNSIEAFAVRVARNHCLDVIKGRRTVSLDVHSYYRDRLSDESDPHEQLSRQDSVSLIKRIISEMQEPYRSVIQMRDVDGYSNVEICEVLGMTDGNVRVVLSRARKRVREVFETAYGYGSKTSKGIVAEIL